MPVCGIDCEPGQIAQTGPAYTPYPFGTWDDVPGYDDNGTAYDITHDSHIFTGYAIDWDAVSDPDSGLGDPINVRVDIDRWNTNTTPYWTLVRDHSELVLANQPRAGLPLSITRYVGNRHGFSIRVPVHNLSLPMGMTWIGRVCFTAVNVGPGADRPLLRMLGGTPTNCWTNIPLS